MSTIPAKIDVRDFPPVEVAPEPPEKCSQSFLSKLDSCPRSAYFYLRYGGGAGSKEMSRGSAFHIMAEQATVAAVAQKMATVGGDVARDLVWKVLSENKDLVVPESEHDDLRLMSWNWGEAYYLDPKSLVSCEEMWEARLGNWTLRGKVDLAYMEPGILRVEDYKTGPNLPSQDKVKKEFQGKFYCWLTANGHPEGAERPIPNLNRVAFQQTYPFRTDSETGELVSRGFEMDQNALADFENSLLLLLERLEEALETKEWPAQKGSHCKRCPSPKECPIPAHLNEHLPLSSEHEAKIAGALVLDLEERKDKLRDALKAWVDQNGSLEVGDLEFGYEKEEKKSLDKVALNHALTTGEAVSEDDLYQKSYSTRFDHRLSDRTCADIQEAVANGESKASQARAYETTPYQINKALERNVA